MQSRSNSSFRVPEDEIETVSGDILPFKVDKESMATIRLIKPDLASAQVTEKDLETKVLVKAAQAESKLEPTKDRPRPKSIIQGYMMPKIGAA